MLDMRLSKTHIAETGRIRKEREMKFDFSSLISRRCCCLGKKYPKILLSFFCSVCDHFYRVHHIKFQFLKLLFSALLWDVDNSHRCSKLTNNYISVQVIWYPQATQKKSIFRMKFSTSGGTANKSWIVCVFHRKKRLPRHSQYGGSWADDDSENFTLHTAPVEFTNSSTDLTWMYDEGNLIFFQFIHTHQKSN